MMVQVGMITIGQAPRVDVAPIVEKYLEDRAKLVQVGVLDGLSRSYIEEHLHPEEGDYVLTSRLTTGESVVMAREKIQPLLQSKIDGLEAEGVKQILLLCTGQFPGIRTNTAYLIEPDHIIPPAVKAMTGNRRLGVIVPLAEQIETLRAKYEPVGLEPVFAVANPYAHNDSEYRQAVLELKGNVDLILLDCMGYTEQSRKLVADIADLPVVLSNAIMAKLLSEMM